jgi:hypothetical protein
MLLLLLLLLLGTPERKRVQWNEECDKGEGGTNHGQGQ